MFAIIRLQGKQYLISRGDILEVDKLNGVKKDQTFTIDDVLLYVDSKKQKVGKPKIKGAEVKAKILEPFKKGKKLEVIKFKPKKRYFKKQGSRSQFTVLKIERIVCK